MYLAVKFNRSRLNLRMYIGDHADEVNIGVSSVQDILVLSHLTKNISSDLEPIYRDYKYGNGIDFFGNPI